MKDSSWESKHTMMTKSMKRRKLADACKRRLSGNGIMANLWLWTMGLGSKSCPGEKFFQDLGEMLQSDQ